MLEATGADLNFGRDAVAASPGELRASATDSRTCNAEQTKLELPLQSDKCIVAHGCTQRSIKGLTVHGYMCNMTELL